jgi:ribonuclease P protein component
MTAPSTPEEIKPIKPEKTGNGRSTKQSLAGVRLRKHADFQRAYAAGRKRQSASMSWFLAPRAEAPQPEKICKRAHGEPADARVGLTVGKVLGKSHERNRIKRRMRDALRRHVDLLPEGADLILHPRRGVLTMEFTKLEAEIVRILTQARADAERFASQHRLVSPA